VAAAELAELRCSHASSRAVAEGEAAAVEASHRAAHSADHTELAAQVTHNCFAYHTHRRSGFPWWMSAKGCAMLATYWTVTAGCDDSEAVMTVRRWL
jgi:hypothetical protein